ncbi:MAG: Hsp20/alpha crystallin family protein [Anaerolineales bacterium]|nr:Hsp20/alpha crystallin family protein [Anaerolineales bacterium]
MSNLIRWEPLSEMVSLREAMDRLFDDAYTRPGGMPAGFGAPVLDLYQTKDQVVVRASLPGMKSDEVEIAITGDLLSLKGEFKDKQESQDKTYHLRESRYGAFERTLRLPTEVESDKAKAEFEDGVLTITLPKAEAVRPKTITVKAK